MKTPRKQVLGWVLYDWANSAFSTVVITFVFATYFGRGIVGNETEGSALWGYALAASGFFIAILSPLAGAVADYYGAPKKWLLTFMGVSLIGISGLWFGTPNADQTLILLVLASLVIANIGFELSFVFYSALLPSVAEPQELGKISNWGWAAGYAGGLCALAAVLFALVGLGPIQPLISLPTENAEHIRAAIILTVFWYALFSLPLIAFVDKGERSGLTLRQSLEKGFFHLGYILKDAARSKGWRRFLIASALYRDGLNTLFAVGGIYAAGRFGMITSEILVFGIALNVTAGLGCLAAGFLEDRLGSSKLIRVSLVGLMITGTGVILAPDKALFFIAALTLGLFVGPLQASSRTYVARLSTAQDVSSRFGLYSLTGKAVSFLGPLCFAIVTDITDNQAWGLSTLLVFWAVGYAMVKRMEDPA